MSSAQNVEMKVKHGLATMYTGIDDETIPGIGDSLQFRNVVAGQHQMSEQPDIRILHFGNRRHMFSGDDERMSWRLRINVVERDDHIVFIDERRWNGSPDDLAKDAVAHEVVPFLKPDFPNRVASSL